MVIYGTCLRNTETHLRVTGYKMEDKKPCHKLNRMILLNSCVPFPRLIRTFRDYNMHGNQFQKKNICVHRTPKCHYDI
jgi:hypothetical protein